MGLLDRPRHARRPAVRDLERDGRAHVGLPRDLTRRRRHHRPVLLQVPGREAVERRARRRGRGAPVGRQRGDDRRSAELGDASRDRLAAPAAHAIESARPTRRARAPREHDDPAEPADATVRRCRRSLPSAARCDDAANVDALHGDDHTMRRAIPASTTRCSARPRRSADERRERDPDHAAEPATRIHRCSTSSCDLVHQSVEPRTVAELAETTQRRVDLRRRRARRRTSIQIERRDVEALLVDRSAQPVEADAPESAPSLAGSSDRRSSGSSVEAGSSVDRVTSDSAVAHPRDLRERDTVTAPARALIDHEVAARGDMPVETLGMEHRADRHVGVRDRGRRPRPRTSRRCCPR